MVHGEMDYTLQLKYVNLCVLVDIARVQYISTTQCEQAFSIQSCIKTKICNDLQTKNLECIICVAIEGMSVVCGFILIQAIALWKNYINSSGCFLTLQNTFQYM